jgi:hypothetical protein
MSHPASGGEANRAGARQTSDRAGSGGGGASGASNPSNLCSDYVPPPSDAKSCKADRDCQVNVEYCQPPGEPLPQCGTCESPGRTCVTSGDCPPGAVCAEYRVTCPCTGDATGTRCQSACSPDSCASDERCDADTGVCEARSCRDDYVCPDDYLCSPDSTARDVDAHGCAPVRCESGFECAPNTGCSAHQPGHGCEPKGCRSDENCDCGACVNSQCASGPGTCQNVRL